MATLTIKGIPDDVYLRLKRRAEAQRRSLNREIILCLERSLGTDSFDLDAWLQEAAQIKAKVKGPGVSEARLRAMKRQGRN